MKEHASETHNPLTKQQAKRSRRRFHGYIYIPLKPETKENPERD